MTSNNPEQLNHPEKPDSSEPPEPWELEFDEDFFYVGRCGREGVIEGKRGGMVFDEKGSQLGAIKAFIRKVAKEEREKGKREGFKLGYREALAYADDDICEEDLDYVATKFLTQSHD